jgi:hypothetical protein
VGPPARFPRPQTPKPAACKRRWRARAAALFLRSPLRRIIGVNGWSQLAQTGLAFSHTI